MFKGQPFFFLLRQLWKFSPTRRAKIVWSLFLQITTLLLQLLPPLVLAYVLNIIQAEGVTGENIYKILLLLFFNYVFFEILFWALWYPSRIWEQKTAFLVRVNIRDFLLKGVYSLGLDWHNDQKSGDVIDKINKSSEALFYFSKSLYSNFSTFINLFGSVVIILFFDWRFILILPIFVFLYVVLVKHFDKNLLPAYRSLNKKENRVQEKIFDNVSNISTIKILQLEKIVQKIIHKFSVEPAGLDHQKNIWMESKWLSVSLLSNVFFAAVLAVYIWWNYQSNVVIEIGTLAALIQYLQKFKNSIFNAAGKIDTLMVQKTRVKNAENLEIDFSKNETKKTNKILPKTWQKILIPKLRFKYEDLAHKKHALDIKNLQFGRGEKIALLGESGSGKTTFLKILRGVNEVESDVLIDGGSHKNNFKILHNSSMLVPQEPEIFATTIKDNIGMYSGVSLKKLKKFVKMARFEKVIEKMPQKWKSVVGEKGVRLSGGEKQRLALSRALLFCENKDIVLLDESTSSVDAVNEMAIYQNIFAEYSQKVIFASIHKMNLVSAFDRIILFADGKIIADGSFEDLIVDSAEFKVLWDSYKHS